MAMPFCASGTVVGEFDIAFDTVKEGWSYGEESIAGVAIGNCTDVFVYAEDLLDDDQAADGFAGGAGRHRRRIRGHRRQ